MSKLEFKITEIPEGQSHRELLLGAEALDLGEYVFEGGSIDLEFYRTQFFIRVDFMLDVEVELICDRSLESFSYPVETEYEVVFKVDVEEETENENGAVRRFNFDTNTLSIEEEVRDTILLAIPIKKLHPKFLDEQGEPKQYKEESFGDLSDKNEGIDPRWEKLKKLKNN